MRHSLPRQLLVKRMRANLPCSAICAKTASLQRSNRAGKGLGRIIAEHSWNLGSQSKNKKACKLAQHIHKTDWVMKSKSPGKSTHQILGAFQGILFSIKFRHLLNALRHDSLMAHMQGGSFHACRQACLQACALTCCLTPQGKGQQQAQRVDIKGGSAGRSCVDAVTGVRCRQRVGSRQQQEVA